MALAVVNAVSAASTGGVLSITSPSFTSTPGNLLVANVCNDSTAGIASWQTNPMSDNKSNPSSGWAVGVAKFVNASGNEPTGQYYLKNFANGGAGHTVTFQPSTTASDFEDICIVEISGADTTAPLDVSATGLGSSANPHASANTATTSVANEICVAGGFVYAGSNYTFTSNNGFTVQTSQGNGGTGDPLFLSTKIVSSTGAQHESFNASPDDNANWGCYVATYKAAASGPPQIFGTPFGAIGQDQMTQLLGY